MTAGERPPELVGTWRIVRVGGPRLRGPSTPDAMAYDDRPFVIEGDRMIVGDGATWVRAAERVR